MSSWIYIGHVIKPKKGNDDDNDDDDDADDNDIVPLMNRLLNISICF